MHFSGYFSSPCPSLGDGNSAFGCCLFSQLSSTARAVCWQGAWSVVGITYARFKVLAGKPLKQGKVSFYFQGTRCMLCIQIWECLANTELCGPLSTSKLYFFKFKIHLFLAMECTLEKHCFLIFLPQPNLPLLSSSVVSLSTELLSCVEGERDTLKAFTSFSLQDLIWNPDTLPDYVFLLQNL